MIYKTLLPRITGDTVERVFTPNGGLDNQVRHHLSNWIKPSDDNLRLFMIIHDLIYALGTTKY